MSRLHVHVDVKFPEQLHFVSLGAHSKTADIGITTQLEQCVTIHVHVVTSQRLNDRLRDKIQCRLVSVQCCCDSLPVTQYYRTRDVTQAKSQDTTAHGKVTIVKRYFCLKCEVQEN